LWKKRRWCPGFDAAHEFRKYSFPRCVLRLLRLTPATPGGFACKEIPFNSTVTHRKYILGVSSHILINPDRFILNDSQAGLLS
jgi:hypothetical protein